MSESDKHILRLNDEEYSNLFTARAAMYGEDAPNVEMSHVVSLLALEELRRSEKRELAEEAMSREWASEDEKE